MSMPDPDTCYRAVESRDRSFDGCFFTAVLTTGIYCRPVCPARTPLRRNVRFYPSSAAAEEAGFRACLRCHPEAAPGSPGWLGTEATVARGLRMIAAGVLDRGGVARMATELGVGPRHLRRLFLKHVGASPVAVAQTRRAHLAKRLIEATELPMITVASRAGFASLRRFNAVLRTTFGRTPSELRRLARRART